MKITFEFNLPEDQDDFEIHKRAVENESSLYEIRQYIRGLLKHTEISDETALILTRIRDLIPEGSL